MQTLNNPFEPCNKLRGKYFSKEVFLRPSCDFIMRRLFVRLLSLCQYVSSIYMYAICIDLVLVPAEFFKDSKRTWLP